MYRLYQPSNPNLPPNGHGHRHGNHHHHHHHLRTSVRTSYHCYCPMSGTPSRALAPNADSMVPNGVHLHPFSTHLAPIYSSFPLLARTQGSFRPLPVYATPAMPCLPASLVRPPPLVFAPLQHHLYLPAPPSTSPTTTIDRNTALQHTPDDALDHSSGLFSPAPAPFGPPSAPVSTHLAHHLVRILPRNTSRNLHLHPSTPTPPILPYVSPLSPTISPARDRPIRRLHAYRSLS